MQHNGTLLKTGTYDLMKLVMEAKKIFGGFAVRGTAFRQNLIVAHQKIALALIAPDEGLGLTTIWLSNILRLLTSGTPKKMAT